MLLEKVSLLNNQINTFEKINAIHASQDSLRLKKIDLYKNAYEKRSIQYKEVNKNFKKYKVYSVLGGIAAFILGLCL